MLEDDCKDRSLVPADVVLSHNDKECIMGLDSVVLREGGSTVSVLDNIVVTTEFRWKGKSTTTPVPVYCICKTC